MKFTWDNSLGKVVLVYFSLTGIQILEVTYMFYLGKVFESLTDKI